MSDNIITVTDANFGGEVLKSNVPVLVDFWAEWCGPCRMLAPIIEAIARDYTGKIRVAKMNVDDNPQVPPSYRVQSIPTLLLFKNGHVADQLIGNLPRHNIERMLERHLG
jgi:thioredoxin 1